MNKKLEEKLEKLAVKKSADVELASRRVSELASNLATNISDFKKIAVLAIVEKSSVRTEQFKLIGEYLPLGSILRPKEELVDVLSAYNVWLRFRSFTRLGTFSSLVFTFFGVYLSYFDYLPLSIGGPLTALFSLLSLVFSIKLLQYRKFQYED